LDGDHSKSTTFSAFTTVIATTTTTIYTRRSIGCWTIDEKSGTIAFF